MRKLVPLLAVAALLSSAAPAAAEFSSSFGFFEIFRPGERVLSQTELPVSVSGQVSVEYKGSAASGCARLGQCDTSGTLVWDPGTAAELLVLRVFEHGRRKLSGQLALGESPHAGTTAQTRRALPGGGAGLCGDSRAGTDTFVSLDRAPFYSLSVGLVGHELLGSGNPLETRCPGPLESDLVRLLPVRRVKRSLMRHGGRIDLSTVRPFDTAGFSGVLRSTVVLRVLPPREDLDDSIDDIGSGSRRYREMELAYRIQRIAGSLDVGFRGLGDPSLCLELDACGTTGSVTHSLGDASGRFAITAFGRANRPRRDFRTLLGLAKGGRTAGLFATGGGVWRSRTGQVTAALSHADGGAGCSDAVPLPSGLLTGHVGKGRLTLYYGAQLSGDDDSLHTRCGGPLESELLGDRALASGSVPLTALRRRQITVALVNTPGNIAASGYSASIHSGLTVTLRRTRVREHVFREPAG